MEINKLKIEQAIQMSFMVTFAVNITFLSQNILDKLISKFFHLYNQELIVFYFMSIKKTVHSSLWRQITKK